MLTRLIPSAVAILILAASPVNADDNKSWMITINPIGSALGVHMFGAEFAVSDTWSVGPEFAVINSSISGSLEDMTTKGAGAGVRATWQAGSSKAIGDGWVWSNFAYYIPKLTLTQKVKNIPLVTPGTYEGEYSYFVLASTFGYRWIWGFFSLKLAGGLGYNSQPKTVELKYQSSSGSGTSRVDRPSGVVPAAEVTLGFAF